MLDGGDPAAVLRAMVEQARKAGLPLFRDPTGRAPTCVARTASGELALDQATDRGTQLLGVRCRPRHDRVSETGATSFTVDLQQGLSGNREAALSHVVLTYYQHNDGQGQPLPGAALLSPDAVPEIPAIPVSSPSLPAPGELFGTPLDDTDLSDGLRVPATSRAAAPAAEGDCVLGGFVAVLAITDVTATLGDLERQVVAQGFEVSHRDAWRTEDHTVTVLATSAAGAGHLNATAVSRGVESYVAGRPLSGIERSAGRCCSSRWLTVHDHRCPAGRHSSGQGVANGKSVRRAGCAPGPSRQAGASPCRDRVAGPAGRTCAGAAHRPVVVGYSRHGRLQRLPGARRVREEDVGLEVAPGELAEHPVLFGSVALPPLVGQPGRHLPRSWLQS